MLRNNPLKSLSNILYRKMYSVKKDSTPSTKRTTLLAIEELQKSVDKSQNFISFSKLYATPYGLQPP